MALLAGAGRCGGTQHSSDVAMMYHTLLGLTNDDTAKCQCVAHHDLFL